MATVNENLITLVVGGQAYGAGRAWRSNAASSSLPASSSSR